MSLNRKLRLLGERLRSDHSSYTSYQLIRVSQLALDERQLAFLTNANAPSTTTTALPHSPTSMRVTWHPSPSDMVIPMNNVVEPIPPSQAASSILNVP